MSQPYVNNGPVTTYRQLRDAINLMNDEQMDSNITVQEAQEDDLDEFYPAELRIIRETDVLDENHPVIYIPL